MSGEDDTEEFETRDLGERYGDANTDPGIVAEWDQQHQDAIENLRTADKFFLVSVLGPVQGTDEMGVRTWVGFANLPDDEAETRQLRSEVLRAHRSVVDQMIQQCEEE